MLHVVQTAAWDWAPPHMSGYPHLPAPPPQYQQTYDEDPQLPSYPPLPGGPPPHGEPPRVHPPPLPYGAPPRGHPPPAVWRATAGSPASPALWCTPRRIGRAAGASSEGAARPIHRCGREQEGAWAAAEPTRSYVLRCGFQCVVCTEP